MQVPFGRHRSEAKPRMQTLDYLVIAPHPDDAELGVGGTILLLQAQERASAFST